MSEKSAPEIRFKGYTVAWERRKLGDLLSEVKRPIHMKDEEEYQLVTVKRRNGGIVSRGFFKGKDILVKNYFILHSGDYLISKRQVVHGANGIVPKNLDGAIVSNEYLIAFGNKNITSEFLSVISKLPQMYKLFFLSSYGIDIEKLVFDVEDWKKRQISIPSIDEQNEIIFFFNKLNELIALHQRKLNKLIQLKQGYLKLIFDQKLRFLDFKNKWLDTKLANVADIISGGTPNTSIPEYWNGDIDWYSPTEIGKENYVSNSNKKITELGLKNSSAKWLPANKTILFTSRAGIGDMAILTKEGTTNQGFQSLIIKETNDVYFIFSFGKNIKEYALKNASGSTFLEISGKSLGRMDISIPSLNEQIKIGNLFKKIDRIINLEKAKIEQLMKLKKAYSQKMFI